MSMHGISLKWKEYFSYSGRDTASLRFIVICAV